MRRKKLLLVLMLGAMTLGMTGCGKFVEEVVVKEIEDGVIDAGSVRAAETAAVQNDELTGEAEGKTVNAALTDEEERNSENTASTDEDEKDSENAASAGTAFEKTDSVPGQVNAPDRYQTLIQEQKNVMNASGEEIHQKILLKVDAPVEVPDAEAIRPKKTVTTLTSDEMFQKMSMALGGNVLTEEGFGASQDGQITVDAIPYEYYCVVGPSDYSGPGMTDMGYYTWQMIFENIMWDGEQYCNKETGETIAFSEPEHPETYREMAEKYLENMGITDFRYANSYEADHSRLFGQEPGCVYATFVEFERIVDGVPITYTSMKAYPSYEFGTEKSSRGYYGADCWYDEKLTFCFYGGKLEQFQHTFPVLIEDASDVPQFLLPFEEIRQIFENTLPDLFAGKRLDDELVYNTEYNDRTIVTQYPREAREDIVISIEEVKLGYLLMKKDQYTKEGELIPVWDFIGTWTAGGIGEDGKEVVEIMDEKKVSLLTVNACDGTVIQRTCLF